MIATRESGVKVQSNITAEGYQAGIDDENMGWVISLFTDLYSDPQRAVIREYSTNAHDAQIEAGVSGPIEITLPSPLAPFFKVKDRGIGLSSEDIRTIYSRYGSSTKRGTNDQNGMLGMGCKSALAYAEQFTVESVKDGMRTVVSISREEGGVPIFTPVATVPDSGPNGTEVIVPVQRHHHDSFAAKAAEFYSFWPADAVLINGEPPQPIDGLKLSDDMTLIKQTGYSSTRKPHAVVMGNVAYPVDNGTVHLTEVPEGYRLIARVPIGSVDFAPSREALLYNKRTRETLEALRPRIRAAIVKAVQNEVKNAKTPREALQLMLKYRSLLGRNAPASALSFKGKPLPERIDGHFVLSAKDNSKLGQHEQARNGLGVDYLSNALVVVGYTLSFTATHKRKLLQYISDNGLDCAYFALTASYPDMTWLDPAQIIQWADVAAVKLPKNSTAGIWRNGRPTGSFDAFIAGNFQHMLAEDIDQDEKVYYLRAKNRWASDTYAEVIGKHDPGATVVCVPENRYAKFMRNFPDAADYTVGLQAAYDAWTASLTGGQRLALAIHDNGSTDTLRMLDVKRIDDPDLKRACYIARNVKLDAVLKRRDSFRAVLRAVDTTGGVEWTCPLEKYALIEAITSHYWRGGTKWAKLDDLYLYLNASYAAQKGA